MTSRNRPLQILIPAGTSSAFINVVGVDDTLDENDETAIIDIVAADFAAIGAAQAQTTIVDDEGLPTVNISVDNLLIAENGGVANFTATLDAVTGRDVTVDFAITGGLAQPAGVDYLESPLTVVIPAGSTDGSISITAVDDALDEFDEDVIIDIVSADFAALGVTQASTAIVDDDLLPDVTISAFPFQIVENGGVATFEVALSQFSGRDVTIDLSVSGTATGGAVDYLGPASTVLTIPEGSLTASVDITAIPDGLDEFDETVIMNIVNADFGIIQGGFQQGTTTILDGDPEPLVTLSVDPLTIDEDGGVATFTATLDTVSAKDVTVNLFVSGTATPAVDFNAPAPQIVIPAGSLTGTLDITAIPDALEEFDELVTYEIVTVVNGVEDGIQEATTSILDPDLNPSISLIVTNTNDSGLGSLRNAIEMVNLFAASPNDPNVIAFDIPGPGPHVIPVPSQLPDLTTPTIIDGTTEPDFPGFPIVQIDGGGAVVDGLRVTGGDVTIHSISITGFTDAGIEFTGPGNNVAIDNHIGVDSTGAPNGNFHGLRILHSSGNVVDGKRDLRQQPQRCSDHRYFAG